MKDNTSLAEPRRRPPRLQELATWTSDWREAWGRRANQLQDEGIPWPEHEIRAFDEMKALKAASGKPPKTAATKPAGKPMTVKAIETTGKLNLGGAG